MPDYIVKVPAKATAVRNFLNTENARFVRDLNDITDVVTEAAASLPIYKVYGRDAKQGGAALKHPRKIRLKFNKYFADRGEETGSLWSVPDIIGFTIVVVFPSDITAVCRILDALVDEKKIHNSPMGRVPAAEMSAMEQEQSDRASSLIVTKYGRALINDGYFACHYNVQARGVGYRPTCEIQIKTVLHDAWGAKSHDLTYKPSGKIDQNLIDNFNSLGDSLAKLDEQSDLVRRAIDRTARVRDQKRRKVQEAALVEVVKSTKAPEEVSSLLNQILELPVAQDPTPLANPLMDKFENNERAVCMGLSLVAVRFRNARIFQQTQELIETWFERQKESAQMANVKSIAALAAYSAGDISLAIEMSEEAIEILEKDRSEALPDDQRIRLEKVANSVCSSLAYYHADRIGSHDGKLGNSREQALAFLHKGRDCRRHLNWLPLGLDSSDEDMEAALADADTAWQSFSTLDNEAFVMIQTASSEADLRRAHDKLDKIHQKFGSTWEATAKLCHDYHDYSARMRLAELESDSD